jgi:AraC-like DNA-binding protein
LSGSGGASSHESWPECLLDPATELEFALFAFAEIGRDFNARRRRLREHVLWYAVRGSCDVETEGGCLRMAPGSLLWVPPGEEHSISVPGRVGTYHYAFRFRVLRGGQDLTFAHKSLLRSRHQEGQVDVERLYDDLCFGGVNSQNRTKASLFMLYTGLACTQASAASPRGLLTPAQRNELACYARDRASDWPTPAQLAHLVALSPAYFARVFRRTFGVTPRRWIVLQRIHQAIFLLHMGRKSIADVSRELGYDDQNLFSRQFHAIVGMTPTEYRSRLTQSADDRGSAALRGAPKRPRRSA